MPIPSTTNFDAVMRGLSRRPQKRTGLRNSQGHPTEGEEAPAAQKEIGGRPMPTPPRRRWHQFSLGTLIWLTLVIALAVYGFHEHHLRMLLPEPVDSLHRMSPKDMERARIEDAKERSGIMTYPPQP